MKKLVIALLFAGTFTSATVQAKALAQLSKMSKQELIAQLKTAVAKKDLAAPGKLLTPFAEHDLFNQRKFKQLGVSKQQYNIFRDLEKHWSHAYNIIHRGKPEELTSFEKKLQREGFTNFKQALRDEAVENLGAAGSPAMAEYLIKTIGLDVNARDGKLNTPLHVVASHLDPAVPTTKPLLLIQIFVKHGANARATNKAGKTALAIARKELSFQEEVLELMKKEKSPAAGIKLQKTKINIIKEVIQILEQAMKQGGK